MERWVVGSTDLAAEPGWRVTSEDGIGEIGKVRPGTEGVEGLGGVDELGCKSRCCWKNEPVGVGSGGERLEVGSVVVRLRSSNGLWSTCLALGVV